MKTMLMKENRRKNNLYTYIITNIPAANCPRGASLVPYLIIKFGFVQHLEVLKSS